METTKLPCYLNFLTTCEESPAMSGRDQAESCYLIWCLSIFYYI